jgi:hypothetical protein
MADKTRLLILAGPVEDLRVPRGREARNGARKEDLRCVSSALQMSAGLGALRKSIGEATMKPRHNRRDPMTGPLPFATNISSPSQ